jgi:hypothetical protein
MEIQTVRPGEIRRVREDSGFRQKKTVIGLGGG